MGLPIHRKKELPRRFPVGAKYVVEGCGSDEGRMRVIARYIVLPSGRRINVPPELPLPASVDAAFPPHDRKNSPIQGPYAFQWQKICRAGELADPYDVGCIASGEAPQPLTLNHPALNPGRESGRGSLISGVGECRFIPDSRPDRRGAPFPPGR
jgi:hypothetical protein